MWMTLSKLKQSYKGKFGDIAKERKFSISNQLKQFSKNGEGVVFFTSLSKSGTCDIREAAATLIKKGEMKGTWLFSESRDDINEIMARQCNMSVPEFLRKQRENIKLMKLGHGLPE